MLSSNSINNPLILNENLDGEQNSEQSIEQIVPEEVSISTLGGEQYKCNMNTSISSLIRANGLCEHRGLLSFVQDYNGKFSAYLSNGLAPMEEEEEENPAAGEDFPVVDNGVPNLDGLVDSNGMLKAFVTLGLLSELYEKLSTDGTAEQQIDEEEGKNISIPFNTTQSLDEALRDIENDYNNDLAIFRKERTDRIRDIFSGGLIGGMLSIAFTGLLYLNFTATGPDKISGGPLIGIVLVTVLFDYSFLSVISGCFAEMSACTNNNLGEPCLSTNKLRSRTLYEQELQQDKCNPVYLDPRDLSNNSCATTFRAYGETARAKDEFDRLRSVAPYAQSMER